MPAMSGVFPTYVAKTGDVASMTARSTFFIWPVFRRHSPNHYRQKSPGLLASLTRG
jgi:hypothetical protein